MKRKTKIAILAALLSVAITAQLHARGTACPYQGRLLTSPADGVYDLTFALFNASSGVSQAGSTVTDASQSVANGLFTFTMDFGAGIFDGTSYRLQIGVRTNGAAGPTNPVIVPATLPTKFYPLFKP